MSAERPWSAQTEPSVGQVAGAIARRYPALRTAHLRLLGRGWDNTAFLTEDDIVFRFPRRAAAAALLDTEAAVLPRLAGRLPVAVPDPQWRGEPGTTSRGRSWGTAGCRAGAPTARGSTPLH